MKVLSQKLNIFVCKLNIFVCKIYLSYTIILEKNKKELRITMQAVLIYFNVPKWFSKQLCNCSFTQPRRSPGYEVDYELT